MEACVCGHGVAALGPTSFWVAAFVSGRGCHKVLANVLTIAIWKWF